MELSVTDMIAIGVALASIVLSIYTRSSDSNEDRFKEVDEKLITLYDRLNDTDIKVATIGTRVDSNEKIAKEIKDDINHMKKTLDRHMETLTKIETKLNN